MSGARPLRYRYPLYTRMRATASARLGRPSGGARNTGITLARRAAGGRGAAARRAHWAGPRGRFLRTFLNYTCRTIGDHRKGIR